MVLLLLVACGTRSVVDVWVRSACPIGDAGIIPGVRGRATHPSYGCNASALDFIPAGLREPAEAAPAQ
ncbi:hypothetical protein CR079_27475, partial [Salmonella enterica subsp. enterica serovar Typhimurium]